MKDELDITLNSCPAGEHEPVAERNNRVIGERIRAVYHHLPFKKIPKIMLKYLAMECAEKLNYFPAKVEVLPITAPTQL